jgi:cell division transport system permease protein
MATATRKEGASQSRTGLRDRLRSWLAHHRLSLTDSLQRLLRSPFSSVLTWLVIGIALALPVGLSVALENVRIVSGNWDSPAQISLFLRAEMSLQAAEELQQRLLARDDVAATRLVSRQEALQEFQQLSGFGDVLRNLDDNPLPNLILVTPAAGSQLGERAALLQARLQQVSGVARAVLDMAWVQRLNALMYLSQRLVKVLAAILALGVLLVIGNTIRLAIENRREEIVVVKLVGGSNAFVRRPFLYTGLWYGLGGAGFSWLIVSLALWGLRDPLSALALLYQSDFHLQGLNASSGLQLLLLGCVLGLVGAWLAVARHLSVIQPR